MSTMTPRFPHLGITFMDLQRAISTRVIAFKRALAGSTLARRLFSGAPDSDAVAESLAVIYSCFQGIRGSHDLPSYACLEEDMTRLSVRSAEVAPLELQPASSPAQLLGYHYVLAGVHRAAVEASRNGVLHPWDALLCYAQPVKGDVAYWQALNQTISQLSEPGQREVLAAVERILAALYRRMLAHEGELDAPSPAESWV